MPKLSHVMMCMPVARLVRERQLLMDETIKVLAEWRAGNNSVELNERLSGLVKQIRPLTDQIEAIRDGLSGRQEHKSQSFSN